MTRVRASSVLAALVLCAAGAGAAKQALTTIHIKVTMTTADGHVAPIAKHALLISDEPVSAAPRRVVTNNDGAADVRLTPGSYTIESDHPSVFQGQAYEWVQRVTVPATREFAVELNAANASIGDAATAAPDEVDLSSLFATYQDSVVTVWGETARGSGFLIDAKGFVATNQQNVGAGQTAEVQLTPTVKVAARVVARDRGKNVAILWIDPAAVAAVRPMRLKYGQPATGQKIFTIGSQLFQPKFLTFGTVSRVGAHTIDSDLDIDRGSAGGPVFTPDGDVIGITSATNVIRIEDARDLLSAADAQTTKAAPPKGTLLPIEPAQRMTEDELKRAAQGRSGNLKPAQMPAADFLVSFITPVMTYGSQAQADRVNDQWRKKRGPGASAPPETGDPLDDFTNWTAYVRDFQPVLMIRVTPKFVKGFWQSVAREAVRTQGVDLGPGGRHLKVGFLGMRAFCGDTEVAPIHPFKIEHRMTQADINGDDVIYEGLYVFDPAALGPSCSSVKLVLFGEKDPAKGDPRVVDAKLLQQIWQDFPLVR